MKELINIQSELKAPKNQHNSFGNYNYRSAEDILEAVKPLLAKNKCSIVISDEIVNISDRFYVKATAKIICGEASVEATAYAREELAKKGMDGAQVTGSASSYARKYALNGLLCIDDSKDPDAITEAKEPQKSKATDAKPDATIDDAIGELDAAADLSEVKKVWGKYPQFKQNADFVEKAKAKSDEFSKE